MLWLILCVWLVICMNVECLYHVQTPLKEECSCYCTDPSKTDVTVCQKLSRFEKELSTVKDAIEHRTRYINEINILKEKLEWQEYFVETLSKQVESLTKLAPENPLALIPQPLVMRPEDEMQNDSGGGGTRTMDRSEDLAQDVSSLMAKVEVFENMTMVVQEELESERRERRSIAGNLSEAQTSIRQLKDTFLNFTLPNNDDEKNVFSALESLNRTFFEDHLQKLYYKVEDVAYKYETRKLDERLENLETELHSGTNVSSISELNALLRNITEALTVINNNTKERFDSEDHRLNAIETKISKLDDLSSLSDQIEVLLKANNLTQGSISDLWNGIEDSKNFSLPLQKQLDSRILNVENRTSLFDPKQSENLSSEIAIMKTNLSSTQEILRSSRTDMNLLAADVAITESKVHDLNFQLEARFSDVHEKLDNITEEWVKALDMRTQEILDKNSKKFEELTMIQLPTDVPISKEDVNYVLNEDSSDEKTYEIVDFKKIDNRPCSLPASDDSHLHITLETSNNGEQNVVFACSPIGQYALSETPEQMRCENGAWTGTLPTCMKLLTEEEINSLSIELASKNPCTKDPFGRDFSDPIDCSRYFRCWNGKAERARCPARLHFNSISRMCLSPNVSMCSSFDTPETLKLKDLIPTILIEPNNVDKPYGLMGTSDSGHLVVYPKTPFRLHCVYPENMWGPPEWYIDTQSHDSSSALITSSKAAKNRITASVIQPKVVDSGVYTCRSPFGKELSITVIVKAISCLAFDLEPSQNQNPFYRPHPEGLYRVLSTVAQFQCEGGKIISATCLASGKWSRPPPTDAECLPKKSSSAMPWKCPQIDIHDNPHLVLEPHDAAQMVTFKCAGNSNLIGSPFSRCRADGTWSHSELPQCLPR